MSAVLWAVGLVALALIAAIGIGAIDALGWPSLDPEGHDADMAAKRQARHHRARTKAFQLETGIDEGAAKITAELNRMRARSDAARKSWNERGSEASELMKGMYDDGHHDRR